MKRLRPLLLPFAAVLEVILMAYCWAISMFAPDHALGLYRWVMNTLPDVKWYFGR